MSYQYKYYAFKKNVGYRFCSSFFILRFSIIPNHNIYCTYTTYTIIITLYIYFPLVFNTLKYIENRFHYYYTGERASICFSTNNKIVYYNFNYFEFYNYSCMYIIIKSKKVLVIYHI